MLELTDDQRQAMLRLESSENHIDMPVELIQQLIDKGLLYKRDDGALDLTGLGESVSRELQNGN